MPVALTKWIRLFWVTGKKPAMVIATEAAVDACSFTGGFYYAI